MPAASMRILVADDDLGARMLMQASLRKIGMEVSLAVDGQDALRAILAMAASLGMRVTAEGVETLEQAHALDALDCQNLQGHYFSQPVPAAQIPALLARRWTLDPAAEPVAAGQAAVRAGWLAR